jgi:hypothetical protein
MVRWAALAPFRGVAAGAGLAFLVLAAGTAATVRPVSAVTPPSSTVDTLADGHLASGATTCTSAAAGGACTLRAALELNDAGAGGTQITLGKVGNGQFQLTLGELAIAKSVSITGSGPSASAVLASKGARVFDIDETGAVVTMAELAIENGAAGGQDVGGGIVNSGSLTLRDVAVQGNTAGFGGGIADFGTLTLQSGVLVTKNHASGLNDSATDGEGGGVAEFGTLTATGAVLSANEAGSLEGEGDGGFGGNLAVGPALDQSGAIVLRGHASITASTIGQGAAGFGGGVFADNGETVAITASTFAGNVAKGGGSDGGGLLNACGAVTLTNDTFDANQAPQGFGGAVDDVCSSDLVPAARAALATPRAPTTIRAPRVTVPAPPATAPRTAMLTSVAPTPTPAPTPSPVPAAKPSTSLDFVTIADSVGASAQNFAAGAGLVSAGDASNVTVHDSIIANGANNAAHNCATFESKIVSLGNNLEDRNDCGFNQAGDLVSRDPKLGALAANGGPTQTMALTAGTPAVDAAGATCDAATDQRGVTRPQGPGCDIGAFELAVASTTPTPTPTALPQPPVTGVTHDGSVAPAGIALAILALLLLAGGAGALLLLRRARAA